MDDGGVSLGGDLGWDCLPTMRKDRHDYQWVVHEMKGQSTHWQAVAAGWWALFGMQVEQLHLMVVVVGREEEEREALDQQICCGLV